MQKREKGNFSCYSPFNIIDFSPACISIQNRIIDGRNVMTALYFGLATTNVPDDTIFQAQENIICTVPKYTPKITATVGASVGGVLLEAHAPVTFSLYGPNWEGINSICMFTEGTGDDGYNVADPITLAQARDLLYTMLTKPNTSCKTCGRIPIRYPNVGDGSSGQGGILKIDGTSKNNCLGNCTGPNSFYSVSATTSPSPSPSVPLSPSISQSAGSRFTPSGGSSGLVFLVLATMASVFGAAIFASALPC